MRRENHRSQSTIPETEHFENLRSPTLSATSGISKEEELLNPNRYEVKPEIFLTPPRESIKTADMSRLARTPISINVTRSSCKLTECETARQLLIDRERDLQNIHSELSEAGIKIANLARKLRSKEHRRAILKHAVGPETEKILEGYLNQIDILEAKIRDKEMLQTFTTQNIEKHMPFDEKYFQHHMTVIRNATEDLMPCETSMACNDMDFIEMSNDLRFLLQRVLGDAQSTLQSISLHSLLRSILSASMCEWVFEREVHEPLFDNCPLRDSMLSHLTTQGV